MMKFAFVAGFLAIMLCTPVFMTGSIRNSGYAVIKNSRPSVSLTRASADVLYDSLDLDEYGLNEKAFRYAWKGYLKLAEKGQLSNADYITICDFSQSSKNKRMYVIDLMDMKVLKNTYVAHGRKSGAEYAQYFSNRPQSNQSSLGFYVTGTTYYGQHGLSLQINGVEKGINDKAYVRRIVIHGADYIGDSFLQSNPFTGRSFGCPAIPLSERDEIINTIKEGTCLFIYHPSKTYLTKSKILNG